MIAAKGTDYRYTVVNGRTVLMEPQSRRIVEIENGQAAARVLEVGAALAAGCGSRHGASFAPASNKVNSIVVFMTRPCPAARRSIPR